jgi:hypothetical protein
MVDKLGGRKAAACLIGLAAVVGCYIAKGAVPAELNEMVKYLVSTYLAGNIAADVVGGINAKMKATAEKAPAPVVQAAPPVDLGPINARIDSSNEVNEEAIRLVGERVETLANMVQAQDQTLKQIVGAFTAPQS